jgi:tetratricopeptide (TPR) repeat protein
MGARAIPHPDDETLRAYGLGRLDAAAADAVTRHLGECADCMCRIRRADSNAGAAPGRPEPGAAASAELAGTVPFAKPTATPPAELANHPDYAILRRLVGGTMGRVYLVYNRLMGRHEVLKLIGPEVAALDAARDRFLREIRAVARLRHSNIVTAYSAFRAGADLVFAMEYVDGLDLARRIKAEGPMPVGHACDFIYQAALGLQHAHEKGMVHRDIKPSNLILTRKGGKSVVKVLDFGLAKAGSEQLASDLRRAEQAEAEPTAAGDLTLAGQMLGTPDYVAPEQIADAQAADIRADIYSLGCTLYHLLTGRPPFPSTTVREVLRAHRRAEARPLDLARPEVPAELSAIVARMMAKDPGRRFQTPREVAEALAPFSEKPPAGAIVAGSEVTTAPAADGGIPPSDVMPSEVGATQGPDRARRRWLRPAGIGAAGMAAILLGIGVYRFTRPSPPARRPGPEVNVAVEPRPEAPPSGPKSPPVEPSPGPPVTETGRANAKASPGPPPPGPMAAIPDIVEVARLNVGHLVQAVAFSPGGRRILIGADDRTAILWDWTSDQRIKELRGHGTRVTSVAISPEGRRALTGDQDGSVRLWNLLYPGGDRGELGRHEGSVTNVAFSPDGRRGYSTGADATVRIWDLDSQAPPTRCEGHKGPVLGLAVSGDGKRLLTGGDTTLILWDAQQGRRDGRPLQGHGRPITCVALLPPYGRFAVSSSEDGTIRLWDLEAREEVRKIGDESTVASWLSVSIDGSFLLSAHRDRAELRLWDIAGGTMIRILPWPKNAPAQVPTRGTFGPDGVHVVWGTGDGYAWVYRLDYPGGKRPESLDVLIHYTHGRTLAGEGKLAEAMDEYREALRIRPNHVETSRALFEAHLSLGKAEMSQDHPDLAADHYRDARRLMPEDAGCRRLLGEALMERGRALARREKFDEAIAEIREATRLNPDDAAISSIELGKIQCGLGNLLSNQGKDEEAIAAFGKAIGLNPKDAAAHHGLGRIRGRRGEREAAIAEYREATRLDTNNADAHLDLATELLASSGGSHRYDEEILPHARKAADLRPDRLTLSTLVRVEHRAGHWDELIAAISRSFKISDGGTTQDRFRLALAYRRKGDTDKAVFWFNNAVGRAKERDREDPEVLRLWSDVAGLLGRPGPVGSGAGPRKSAAPAKSR